MIHFCKHATHIAVWTKVVKSVKVEKSLNAYTTMQLGIMGNKSLALYRC